MVTAAATFRVSLTSAGMHRVQHSEIPAPRNRKASTISFQPQQIKTGRLMLSAERGACGEAHSLQGSSRPALCHCCSPVTLL